MLPSLLLLIFGKLQNRIFLSSPVWAWALVFSLLILAAGVLWMGDDASPIIAAVMGIYAWGYLLLLRRLAGSKWQWFALYLLGGLAPFIVIHFFLLPK